MFFKSAMLELSPLADVAEYVNENLYLIGNRALISLNLSSKLLSRSIYFDLSLIFII